MYRTFKILLVVLLVNRLSWAENEGHPSINSLVAIIETAAGSGTGFLVREENAIWLYSNEHVVRGGPFTLRRD